MGHWATVKLMIHRITLEDSISCICRQGIILLSRHHRNIDPALYSDMYLRSLHIGWVALVKGTWYHINHTVQPNRTSCYDRQTCGTESIIKTDGQVRNPFIIFCIDLLNAKILILMKIPIIIFYPMIIIIMYCRNHDGSLKLTWRDVQYTCTRLEPLSETGYRPCVWHGWFHLHRLNGATRNAKQARIRKWKLLVHSGIRNFPIPC